METQEQARFAPMNVDNAPAAARAMLKASEKKMGFLASPVAKAARSPALLKHMLTGFGSFEETSLSPLEREVVAMTVAFEMECHYCMAMHSALLSRQPERAGMVEALRSGAALVDSRLEALRLFVRSVVRTRGRVPAEHWADLEAQGFTEEQALEAVLGVGVYLVSTLTNIVTDAELDPPFSSFAWR